ncbi:hypothetical protein ACE193_17790 [Bernardetia sp. OM2101]|uniref:hypothetical protein n=1 Tax=Bernardetia sp. OM2101 TaxID=3344876 RepID=UPI0035D0CBD0
MKFTFPLLFLLTFFSQTAFSQDYSKMSANEKAKVIIYGDLYPFSLLLESGTDTLRMYQSVKRKSINLFFEEGKLMKAASRNDTTIFFYEEDRVVRRYWGGKNSNSVYFPKYRNDSLIGISDVHMFEGEYHSGQFYYQEDDCTTNDSSDRTCFYYTKDSIFAIEYIWVFQKDKIIRKAYLIGEDFEVQNLVKMFFIKDGYVHILIENYHTQDYIDSHSWSYDFIMEEKHEIKLKIIKSPKDKPRKKWEEEGY